MPQAATKTSRFSAKEPGSPGKPGKLRPLAVQPNLTPPVPPLPTIPATTYDTLKVECADKVRCERGLSQEMDSPDTSPNRRRIPLSNNRLKLNHMHILLP